MIAIFKNKRVLGKRQEKRKDKQKQSENATGISFMHSQVVI